MHTTVPTYIGNVFQGRRILARGTVSVLIGAVENYVAMSRKSIVHEENYH